MNRSRKGSRVEREAADELVENNYQVFSPPRTKFGQQDIFSMFDVIAINRENVRYIQIKTGSTQGFLQRLRDWANRYTHSSCSWELWVRQDLRTEKQKWKKYIFCEGEKIEWEC